MDNRTRALLAAAGAAAEKTYVEDVFSTYLYTGNGSSQTITNGIDLAGEGGLVWRKNRNLTTGAISHYLHDTVRSPQSGMPTSHRLSTDTTSGQFSDNDYITSWNSDGFTFGTGNSSLSGSGNTVVSWTFRKAPKFFDVVTWTGNGSGGATVSHNLGSTPGFIVYKATTSTGNWFVYHRSLGTSGSLTLNTTDADPGYGRVTAVSSTSFTTDGTGNASGVTYVAYLFAHDAGGFGDDGNQNVISCGSYTTNSSGIIPDVNLGWEPQWLLVKRTDSSENWYLYDVMRGMPVGGLEATLYPNLSNAEVTGANIVELTPTGFRGGTDSLSGTTSTYIYIAIRRGPMKTPTAGTDVFYAETISQADTIDSTNVPFSPDLVNTFSRNGTDRTSGYNLFTFVDRLRGLGTPNNTFNASAPYLIASSTGAENSINQSYVQLKADGRNIARSSGWNSAAYGNWINYFFRRAPGFFDVVAYTGTGSVQNVAHNLGVAPELMIVKKRTGTQATGWIVYSSALGATKRLEINTTGASITDSGDWNDTAPTSSAFTVNFNQGTNNSASTYIAYLFATVPGVSKVGSYTGTGNSSFNVNCGFTAGSRFVLIKRTDNTGDWYVWDSARGLTAFSAPYLFLNSSAAEVTGTSYINSSSSGFSVPAASPEIPVNITGASYIFLAIA